MNVISESMVVAGPIPQATAWPTEFGVKPIAAAGETWSGTPPSSTSTASRRLHRLYEVRRREGYTRRQVAHRLGISIEAVQEREQPTSDMPLSELLRWQKALAVPMAELLQEPQGELSPPVQLRSRLLRAMKTVRLMQQNVRQGPMRRLVETLVAQLLEVMPELKDTAAWPAVGPRRGRHELGQAYFRRISVDPLDELDGPDG
jgi:transcriptional regulator with XRE-family HTH domain